MLPRRPRYASVVSVQCVPVRAGQVQRLCLRVRMLPTLPTLPTPSSCPALAMLAMLATLATTPIRTSLPTHPTIHHTTPHHTTHLACSSVQRALLHPCRMECGVARAV